MRPVFYLFVDGMTETRDEPSSLALARTPTMDRLFGPGTAGFYAPPIATGDTEPRTDVVIPAFFGMRPQDNPGRPALELADLDVSLLPSRHCFFVTLELETLESVNFDAWFQTIGGNVGLGGLVGSHGATIHESIAFNYGRRWIIANCEHERLADIEDSLHSFFLPYEAVFSRSTPVPRSLLSLPAPTRKTYFLGWAKGSLRGAFKHLGARANPFNRAPGAYADWPALSQDFEATVGPSLRSLRHELPANLVLYTKETAFASRRSDRVAKIAGIEFMDAILRRSIALIDREMVVVVASDHSCDIGGTSNPAERTIFLVTTTSPNVFDQVPASRHFCEESVQACAGTVPFSSLLEKIEALAWG